MKTQFISVAVFFCCVAAFTGCATAWPPQPVYEHLYPLDGISEVYIAYDDEAVVFSTWEGEGLLLREYMNQRSSRYEANVNQHDDSLQIREGGKPLFHAGFSRRVEICLPQDYQNNLTVTATSGTLDFSDMELHLDTLRVDCTSGVVRMPKAAAAALHLSTTSGALELGDIHADHIQIEMTSGRVFCQLLDGAVTYTSTSGSAEIQSAIGSGSYTVSQSGTLEVAYTAVTGDLSLFHKNGTIVLTLPADLDFTFAAQTKNGSISADFTEPIQIDGNRAFGKIGLNPQIQVTLETKNGAIRARQA